MWCLRVDVWLWRWVQCFSTPTSQAVYYLPMAGDYYYYCAVFLLFWLNLHWNVSRVLPQRLTALLLWDRSGKGRKEQTGQFPRSAYAIAKACSCQLHSFIWPVWRCRWWIRLKGAEWLVMSSHIRISWCALRDLHFKVIKCSVCTAGE